MAILAALALLAASSASASTLCLQLKPNGAIKGPTTVGGNTCKGGYEKIELPPAAQLETLNKILPHMKYAETGVGAKPTIQVSGVNVQLVNGEGKTETTNGAGNLILGYDEFPRTQTGSHSLILGGDQEYTSFGSIVTGIVNTATGPYSVVFGAGNSATAEVSSVTGGASNQASAGGASVSGGEGNSASTIRASVAGGLENSATGASSAILGGRKNIASGAFSAVLGGKGNTVSATDGHFP
jgi:hypothetical protein